MAGDGFNWTCFKPELPVLVIQSKPEKLLLGRFEEEALPRVE
jgi:hypothetical protein